MVNILNGYTLIPLKFFSGRGCFLFFPSIIVDITRFARNGSSRTALQPEKLLKRRVSRLKGFYFSPEFYR